MKYVFFALVIGLTAYSCANEVNGKDNPATTTTTNTEKVDIRKLNVEFDDAWNKKDSAAISGMLADDVKYVKGRDVFSTKAEVMQKWVMHDLPVVSNLKSTVVSSEADVNTAYEAGNFSLDVNIPNQKVFEATGNYTFIWTKGENNTWKVHFIQLDNHAPSATAAKK